MLCSIPINSILSHKLFYKPNPIKFCLLLRNGFWGHCLVFVLTIEEHLSAFLFPGYLFQNSWSTVWSVSTLNPRTCPQMPFITTSTVLESTLRLELPQALLQIKSVPLGRDEQLFYSFLLPPSKISEVELWSWGWGQWQASEWPPHSRSWVLCGEEGSSLTLSACLSSHGTSMRWSRWSRPQYSHWYHAQGRTSIAWVRVGWKEEPLPLYHPHWGL